MSDSDTDRARAIHEAGHAAVAWWLGLHLERVTIESDGRYRGYVEFEDADDLEIDLKVALAGPVAESLFAGVRERHRFMAADYEVVMRALTARGDGDLALDIDYITAVLKLYRGAVLALADQLVRLRTLTGPQAIAVMAAARLTTSHHTREGAA